MDAPETPEPPEATRAVRDPGRDVGNGIPAAMTGVGLDARDEGRRGEKNSSSSWARMEGKGESGPSFRIRLRRRLDEVCEWASGERTWCIVRVGVGERSASEISSASEAEETRV